LFRKQSLLLVVQVLPVNFAAILFRAFPRRASPIGRFRCEGYHFTPSWETLVQKFLVARPP
jgi:hypothetical protein